MGTVTSEFHNINENPRLQNFSTEFSTPHIRPRSNSAPQENIPNSTSFSNTAIRQSQQRKIVKTCNCGLEPILRDVKADTPNKGRSFWSCRKFGGPYHSERCNFFRWETEVPQNTDVTGESSSTAQNTQDTSETYNNNNNNNDDINNINNNVILGGEIITSPLSNDGDVIARVIENPHRNHNRAPSQAPSNSSNGSITNRVSSNITTGDIYTRKPAVFGNWENVPKYSTPQLLDIVQNHLVQQDKNYQRWYTSTQSAKKDYEEAKKEVEKLMRELDIINREKELHKRENDVLKGEKRLLEREINDLKEENRSLKRRI